jgi:hypothetical protein
MPEAAVKRECVIIHLFDRHDPQWRMRIIRLHPDPTAWWLLRWFRVGPWIIDLWHMVDMLQRVARVNELPAQVISG